MSEGIRIVPRPDSVSYEDISALLYAAHEENRREGFHVKTAEMGPDCLREHIGEDGQCFVALDGDRPVGVTAARTVTRHNRFSSGQIADQILVAVLPEYAGRHLSTLLHEKVVAYAQERGLKQIELRTAEENVRMQRAALKWGFRYADFRAYAGVDHYTAVLLKSLEPGDGALKGAEGYYRRRKALVKLRYKPGKIKRFGI